MYSFREIDLSNGSKRLAIDFDDKSKNLLSIFLMTEVRTFHKYIIPCLDDVLSGQTDSDEFNGNACGMEIHGGITRIVDNLAPDGIGDAVEISTKELRELIDIWLNKLNDFNTKQSVE